MIGIRAPSEFASEARWLHCTAGRLFWVAAHQPKGSVYFEAERCVLEFATHRSVESRDDGATNAAISRYRKSNGCAPSLAAVYPLSWTSCTAFSRCDGVTG